MGGGKVAVCCVKESGAARTCRERPSPLERSPSLVEVEGQALRTLELFAREVMPAFPDARETATTASGAETTAGSAAS